MRSTNYTTLFLGSALLLLGVTSDCMAASVSSADNSPPPASGKTIWTEEFNGPLNESQWSYDTGDGCAIGLCNWGNGEAEWYDKPNVQAGQDGSLKITARRDRPDGKFSSGRINTKGKFEFKYGRVDVRAKMPINDGAFPAIWMLPTNSPYGNWPKSGEIDIGEFQTRWSKDKGGLATPSTLHFQNHYGGNAMSFWATGNDPSQWHTYSVLWRKDGIEFKVDDKTIGEYKPPSLTNPDDWPYNQDFYLIINLALEPSWGTKVPADLNSFELLVDWIRVSQLD